MWQDHLATASSAIWSGHISRAVSLPGAEGPQPRQGFGAQPLLKGSSVMMVPPGRTARHIVHLIADGQFSYVQYSQAHFEPGSVIAGESPCALGQKAAETNKRIHKPLRFNTIPTLQDLETSHTAKLERRNHIYKAENLQNIFIYWQTNKRLHWPMWTDHFFFICTMTTVRDRKKNECALFSKASAKKEY